MSEAHAVTQVSGRLLLMLCIICLILLVRCSLFPMLTSIGRMSTGGFITSAGLEKSLCYPLAFFAAVDLLALRVD